MSKFFKILSVVLLTIAVSSLTGCDKPDGANIAVSDEKIQKNEQYEDDEDGCIAEYDFISPGWATFGIVLPKGEIFTGLKVGNLETQNDIKNHWSDGSIRYVILTTLVEDAGVYGIRESNVRTGSFTLEVPTAELTMDIEKWGIYKSVLSSSVSSDLWLNGPLVKEWRVRDIPKNKAMEHPFLSNTWDIRIYNDGTGTVDAIVENVRDDVDADGVVYSTEIKVNDAITFQHAATRPGKNPISWVSENQYESIDHGLIRGNYFRITSGDASGTIGYVAGYAPPPQPADRMIHADSSLINIKTIVNESWETIFFHQYGSNWRRTIDVNNFSRAEYKIDFRPFINANAVPEYMSTIRNTATVYAKDEWQGMAPLAFSSLTPYMQTTGGRPELGPYPEWAARFLVHQTPELREQTLMLGNLAGSFSLHFTKNDPSQIVTVDDNPEYWLDSRVANPQNKPLNNMAGRKIPFQNDHAPSLAYIPYLVTGDRYYSDEMLHSASFAVMYTSPNYYGSIQYRNGTQGLLWANDVRGIAWAFRNLTDAANYLPDNSQYKAYFQRLVDSNLNAFDNYAHSIAPISPLGFINVRLYTEGNYATIPPWQVAYLAWAVQHEVDQRDDPETQASVGIFFQNMLFKQLFEPAIIKTDFPPEYLAGYYVKYGTRINNEIEYFQTWTEIFETNYVKDGIPDAIPSWGYGAELRLAAIAAKKSGYPGAQKAYDFCVSMSDRSTSKYMSGLTDNSAFAFADIVER